MSNNHRLSHSSKSSNKRTYSPEYYHSRNDYDNNDDGSSASGHERRRTRSRSRSHSRHHRDSRSRHNSYQGSRRHRKHSSSSDCKNRIHSDHHRRDRERERERERSNSRPPPPPSSFIRGSHSNQHVESSSKSSSRYHRHSYSRSRSRSYDHGHGSCGSSVPLIPPPPPKLRYVSEDEEDHKDRSIHHKLSRSKRNNHYMENDDDDGNVREINSRKYRTSHKDIMPTGRGEGYSMNLCNSEKEKAENYDESNKYYRFDTNEPIDKERIHREMEEKLRIALAKEGKVYPPPKAEASHPVFANDGSFLEIFKKMQEQQQCNVVQPVCAGALAGMEAGSSLITSANNSSVLSGSNAGVTYSNIIQPMPGMSQTQMSMSAAAPMLAATGCVPPNNLLAVAGGGVQPSMAPAVVPPPPMFGRRRGGKILKTGMVAKPKVQSAGTNDPKDFWSLYLAEVNKYKNTACESETGNRPLVK